MRRREDKAISKHTLNLYSGDYEALQILYGPRIGAAKIIRDIVHSHLKRVRDGAEQKIELLGEIDVELPTVTEVIE